MMRTLFEFLRAAACVGIVTVPIQASAFWSGPGCMIADMFGMGNVYGGISFSVGAGGYGSSRGPTYGYAYAYGHPYGPGPVYGQPYPGHYAPPMKPYAPPSAAP